jgi:pimeloyl-ACP methyl ester carboxylesterase
MRAHRLLHSLLILTIVYSLTGCTGNAQEIQLMDVGGHQLEMRRTGAGHPVVVIMTGAGDWYATWNAIADRIAEETTVIQYDRAGYGNSENGPLPRTPYQELAELKALLRAAKVKRSYVLVGHSLGTIHALEYARRFPKHVKGVIVIDPPPESWLRGEVFPDLLQMFKEAPAQMRAGAEQARQGGDLKTAAFLAALASEHESLLAEEALEARSGSGLCNIPLVAIAAGVTNPQFGDKAEAYQEYWADQTRQLAERVENGKYIFAAESHHHVHLDDPELVIKAILGLVKGGRR